MVTKTESLCDIALPSSGVVVELGVVELEAFVLPGWNVSWQSGTMLFSGYETASVCMTYQKRPGVSRKTTIEIQKFPFDYGLFVNSDFYVVRQRNLRVSDLPSALNKVLKDLGFRSRLQLYRGWLHTNINTGF